jgi:type I restriction enzyme S subunit
MAWEGALGIVPNNCDGLVVSPEFPVFEVDRTKVFPEVLDIYFRTPSIWPTLSGVSTGTNVRRRRLNPQEFLSYKLPLPSRDTQILLRNTNNRIDAAKRLQFETELQLEAMLPAILDRAFCGEL